MMTRTITIFLLITGLLAKHYLIDVADKGRAEGEDDEGVEKGVEGRAEAADVDRSEGGSDFSFNRKLRMAIDGGRGFRSRRAGGGALKKYNGDTIPLTCNVGSF